MKQDLLVKAKKEYLETPLPEYLMYDGWRDVRIKLEPSGWSLWGLIFKRGFVFAAVTLLFLGSVVGAAQAAKPGDKLYSVKVLADRVLAQVTGNYEVKVQRRAAEVIETSKSIESTPAGDQASREYQKALDEAKMKAVRSGTQEDLLETLEKQEEKFKKESDGNGLNKGKLDEAIEQTEKVKDEIQNVSPPEDVKLPQL